MASPARTMRCDTCAATFEIVELSEQVSCVHCGAVSALPPALRAELAGYATEHAARTKAANQALAVADRWDSHLPGDKPPTKHYLVGFGLFFGLPVVAVLGAVLIANVSGHPLHRDPRLGLVVFGAAMLGALIYIIWSLRGGPARRARHRAGEVATSCPSCGAREPMREGQVARTCSYCGASLLAGEHKVAQVLDETRDREARANIEALHAQTAAAERTAAFNAEKYLPYMISIPFAFMTGGGAIGFSHAVITGTEAFHPGLLILWAMFAVSIAVPVFIYRRRKKRAQS